MSTPQSATSVSTGSKESKGVVEQRVREYENNTRLTPSPTLSKRTSGAALAAESNSSNTSRSSMEVEDDTRAPEVSKRRYSEVPPMLFPRLAANANAGPEMTGPPPTATTPPPPSPERTQHWATPPGRLILTTVKANPSPRLSAFESGQQQQQQQQQTPDPTLQQHVLDSTHKPQRSHESALTPSATPTESKTTTPEPTTNRTGATLTHLATPTSPAQQHTGPPSPPLSIRSLLSDYDYDVARDRGSRSRSTATSPSSIDGELFFTPVPEAVPHQMGSYFPPGREAQARAGEENERFQNGSTNTEPRWDSVIGKVETIVDRLAKISDRRPIPLQWRPHPEDRAPTGNNPLSNIVTPPRSQPSPMDYRYPASGKHQSDPIRGSEPATHALSHNQSSTSLDSAAINPDQWLGSYDRRSRPVHPPGFMTPPPSLAARSTVRTQNSNASLSSQVHTPVRTVVTQTDAASESLAQVFEKLFDDTFMAAEGDDTVATGRTWTNGAFHWRDNRNGSPSLHARPALQAIREESMDGSDGYDTDGQLIRSAGTNFSSPSRHLPSVEPTSPTATSYEHQAATPAERLHRRDATTSTIDTLPRYLAPTLSTRKPISSLAMLKDPELAIFDEPRGSHNILFEYVVEPGKKTITKVLVAASKVKLVEYLTFDADKEFVVDFFVAYRAFMSPRYLLSLILLRIRWALTDCEEGGARRTVLDKALRVLLFWVHHHGDIDFSCSRALRASLGTFLHTYILPNPFFHPNGGASASMAQCVDSIMDAIAREKQGRRLRKQSRDRLAKPKVTGEDDAFMGGYVRHPSLGTRQQHGEREHDSYQIHQGGSVQQPQPQQQLQQQQGEYLDSGTRPYPFFASTRPSLDSIPRPNVAALRPPQGQGPAERTWKNWLFRRRGGRNQTTAVTTDQTTATSTSSSTAAAATEHAATTQNPTTATRITSSTLYRPFVLDYPAHAVAQHFCVVEQELVLAIPWMQLLIADAWRVRNEWGEEVAGQVWKAVDRFNATCYWVATEVFKVDSMEERAAIVEAFIRIAQICMAYNNYSTLLSILLAFKTVEIDQYTPIWTHVTPPAQRVFATLREFCNPSQSFKRIRAAHTRCCENVTLDWSPKSPVSRHHEEEEPPRDLFGAVPFLGIFLNDLAFLDDGEWFLDPFVSASETSTTNERSSSNNKSNDPDVTDARGRTPIDFTRNSQLLFGTRPYRRTTATNNNNNGKSDQDPSSSSSSSDATPTPTRLVNVRRATRTAAVVRAFRVFQHPDRGYTGPALDCGPQLENGVKTLSGVI
ncbi:hypothetical protein DFJ77DRAFT_467482 [Powellomyces hirtus]|nr:hypothetical protein DFJ77DRAFT_467482 [Powellomyces hirtus]